jgi:hypothetical protein
MENSNSSINQDAVKTAQDAFIYGLPLVLMEITKLQSCQKGYPINQFANQNAFIQAGNNGVVRPNFDTFYSTAFFDLSEGPLVLDMPITDAQYYVMPLLDAFTNVIPGSPGTRTLQTQGGQYLLLGPKDADYPVTTPYIPIQCPTDIVWALGRFQVNNPSLDDYAAYGGGQVNKLQSLLAITPTNDKNGPYIPENLWPSQSETANDIVLGMPITDFFDLLNELLLTNPPTAADAPAMAEFATIGVGLYLRQSFRNMGFDDATLAAMQINKDLSMKQMIAGGTPSLTSWNANLDSQMGDYGTNYPLRAGVAVAGLGANLIADAVYYGAYGVDGEPLTGGNKYTITFDEEPPQEAFWSLTMYNSDGYFVDNTYNRYAVGHDSAFPLVKGDDGSITIYIQPEEVDPDNTDNINNNWLPSPSSGNFNVMLRLYWPDSCVIEGQWTPPLIKKVG